MRTSRFAHVLSVILLVAISSSVVAEDSGWKLPNLNPFAKKTTKKRTTRATVSDDDSGFHLPRMPALPKPSLPTFGSKRKTRTRSNQPSTFDRMTQGTKNFFAKSYDVLTPWDNDEGGRSTTRSRSPERVAKRDSWFDFSHKTDEEEIQAVNDFLELPRPMP